MEHIEPQHGEHTPGQEPGMPPGMPPGQQPRREDRRHGLFGGYDGPERRSGRDRRGS